MRKKPTITCGKCGKTSPTGSAHNKRTCGNKPTPQNPPPTLPHTHTTPKPQPTTTNTPQQRKGGVPEKDILSISLEGHRVEGEGYKVKVKIFPRHTTSIESVDLTPHQTATYEYIENNGHRRYWFNTEGYLHRENGPAEEHTEGTQKWWKDGKLHRTDGPAIQHPHTTPKPHTNKQWYINGTPTRHPELCKKATRTDLTDADFYKLCSHPDYTVRNIAAANPNCPPEWRTLTELKND